MGDIGHRGTEFVFAAKGQQRGLGRDPGDKSDTQQRGLRLPSLGEGVASL